MEPEGALRELASRLRAEDSVISPHVRDTDDRPSFGLLAAAGERARETPAEYSLLVETIREGYLLHYGRPRVVVGAEPDLALLAGDYLYARGLERLAALGDLEGVRQLSDLISLCAQLHAEAGDDPRDAATALWLAATATVAGGTSEAYEAAKLALRGGAEAAPKRLWQAALGSADGALATALDEAADDVGFGLVDETADLG
jgi:hypothetical protein